ncbi:PRD domain-containing protein [Paenibacillus barcinonensis]|uniref:PRD domain-containing protein n=1 Tax=Paenibacillus barcinonensis TaxID=198119 RepID=UPI001C127079|nr:PRD domain-containing protein [Paenibacillus barcinonensis]
MNYARFVIHLRYFIKWQTNGEKLTSNDHLLYGVVKDNYQKAFQCAMKIKRSFSTSMIGIGTQQLTCTCWCCIIFITIKNFKNIGC